jgi:hypothetical protein
LDTRGEDQELLMLRDEPAVAEAGRDILLSQLGDESLDMGSGCQNLSVINGDPLLRIATKELLAVLVEVAKILRESIEILRHLGTHSFSSQPLMAGLDCAVHLL